MKDGLLERVQAIQASMVESARPTFLECQLDALRVLIRLTVEFDDYLRRGYPHLREVTGRLLHSIGDDIYIDMKEIELAYSSESTFSGIDFFLSVSGAYSVLVGATKSKIEWGIISEVSLKYLFVNTYREFGAEGDFTTKCRLLLDLFKIQIVFAGVFYENGTRPEKDL